MLLDRSLVHAASCNLGHAAITIIGLIQTILQNSTVFVFAQTIGTPWCVVLFIEKIPFDVGIFLLACMFFSLAGLVESLLREALNANFRRWATFYRVHAEAKSSPNPIALLLRSFGNVHGYLDVQTGFSIFWLLDEALQETGFQPVLLGTDASLPENHGTLLLPTEDEKWQEVFEVFADVAAVIIVVPELTGSLQTELQLLRERGWLAKSVAVMAPASVRVLNIAMEPGVTLGGDDEARRNRWEAARERFAVQGLKLPPYDVNGALIEWSAKGDVSATNLLSFEPSSFQENFPFSLKRRESFCRCWRSLQKRRRFHGKGTRETYCPIAPTLEGSSLRSVLNPPGSDDSLGGAVLCLTGFGWGFPLALFLLSFLI